MKSAVNVCSAGILPATGIPHLTGQADEAAIERARQQANLYACVHKPWTEEELQEIITTALNE